MDFPAIVTCTLQGSSVTQGNPVTFTAKTFAVYLYLGVLLDILIKVGRKETQTWDLH